MKNRVITMQALGSEPDGCAHCGTPFRRGETMNGVTAVNGDPLGWYCGPCLERWKRGDPVIKYVQEEDK